MRQLVITHSLLSFVEIVVVMVVVVVVVVVVVTEWCSCCCNDVKHIIL